MPGKRGTVSTFRHVVPHVPRIGLKVEMEGDRETGLTLGSEGTRNHRGKYFVRTKGCLKNVTSSTTSVHSGCDMDMKTCLNKNSFKLFCVPVSLPTVFPPNVSVKRFLRSVRGGTDRSVPSWSLLVLHLPLPLCTRPRTKYQRFPSQPVPFPFSES